MNSAEIFGLIRIKIPEATKDAVTRAIVIPKQKLLETARYLAAAPLCFDNLHCITAVEKNNNIEIIYCFCSIQKHRTITLKARLFPSPSPLPPTGGEDKGEGGEINNDLNIESLAKLWKSADWLEREIYDLFGVKFLNHPNLKRILNPDEWDVHPLRKNFDRADFTRKPRY